MSAASIPSLRLAFDPSYDVSAGAAAALGAALTDAHNVATLATAQRADGGLVRCFQTDAGARAWGLLVGRLAFWGQWSAEQRDWSSGGRELAGPLQVFLRRPDLVRGAVVVIGFDNASDALAVCWGRARARVDRRLLAALFEAAQDLGTEITAWWCSRRMNAGPDELSKCETLADARRWAASHGFELVVCDHLLDDYVAGSLASTAPGTA